MRSTAGSSRFRQQNLTNTMLYILQHKGCSRLALSEALKLSMPTIFQNVSYLLNAGLICESGEASSTGGRKAKMLSVSARQYRAAGIELTRKHLYFVLSEMDHTVSACRRVELPFAENNAYFSALSGHFQDFLTDCADGMPEAFSLAGCGIAIPGIIDREKGLLLRSHTLGVKNMPLLRLREHFSCPVTFDNDANFAAYAEIEDKASDTLYLSLNETVGGAFYQKGTLYPGDGGKSCEFGHMVLVPNGKKCYCGKRGCADAYCSSSELGADAGQTDRYLDALALLISNLRMAFDCRIVIGGEAEAQLQELRRPLCEKLRQYNLFDENCDYLSIGRLQQKSVAIGAAWSSIERFFREYPFE